MVEQDKEEPKGYSLKDEIVRLQEIVFEKAT